MQNRNFESKLFLFYVSLQQTVLGTSGSILGVDVMTLTIKLE